MAAVLVGNMMVPDVLTCWVLQREAEWERAKRCGVLREDGREWSRMYQWFRDRLRDRVSGARGYPVWGLLEKPDLRCRHFKRGTRAVRIAFHVPREGALLIDSYASFCVLNRVPFVWSVRESDAWEHRFGKRWQWDQLSLVQQQEVAATWERGFALRRPRGSHAWLGRLDVEVLVPEVRMADVVRLAHFVAR